MASNPPTKQRCKWTPADSEKLRVLLLAKGVEAREAVFLEFPEFSRRLVTKNIVLFKKSLDDLWTEAQDQILLKGVLKGKTDWEALQARRIPSKSLDAILRRVNHFRTMLKLDPISTTATSLSDKHDSALSMVSTKFTWSAEEESSVYNTISDFPGMLSELDETPQGPQSNSKNANDGLIKGNQSENNSFGACQPQNSAATKVIPTNKASDHRQSSVQCEDQETVQGEFTFLEDSKNPFGRFFGDEILNLLDFVPEDAAETQRRNSEFWSFDADPN